MISMMVECAFYPTLEDWACESRQRNTFNQRFSIFRQEQTSVQAHASDHEIIRNGAPT